MLDAQKLVILMFLRFVMVANEDAIQVYRGTYTNVDYGFSVVIPPGKVGTGSAIGAPNHGFQIKLHPNTIIWVDATYDVTDPPFHFSKINGKLGSLKAQRTAFVMRGKSVVFHESIIGRGFDRGTAVLYTIAVDCPRFDKDEAFQIFEDVVSSFRLVPISP